MRRLSPLFLAALLAGCASARPSIRTAEPTLPTNLPEQPAADSAEQVFDRNLAIRSSERVAELKKQGGECAAYGSVLESSVQAGRVTVRPYMWRVGGRLVSGVARADGDIVVARHIDPLNVGVRTVDDMVRTLEHEAAHVAFRVSNGPAAVVDLANDIVLACRRGTESGEPQPRRTPG